MITSNEGLKRKVVVLFMLVVFSLGNLLAQSDAYTVITNPGEDASTEMRIGWHTDLGIEGSFIQFTKKTDANWENVVTVAGQYTVSTTWDGIDSRDASSTRFTQNIRLHKYGAVLSNLEPDTEYMYRVGLNNLSDVRYFKTAGAGEFSFAWISDYHHYDPLPNRLANAMNMISTVISANQGVDFILSTGDDVAYGGSYNYWRGLFNQAHFKNYMWVTMNGNHDNMDMTDTKNTPNFFRDTRNNPQNGYAGQEGVSYWFKYGNTLWIVLNTEDAAAQVPTAQAWAADVIRKNPTQYIIVAQHYQWFDGNTGAYSSSGFTRWNAFFDRWGVDLALSGNNHIYVRTHKLYNQQVSADPGKGTVYVQAVSSDGDRGRTMNPTLSSNADKIAYRWTNGTTTVGGSLVTVNENGIKVSLYDNNGTRLDYAEIPANKPNPALLPPVVKYVVPEDLSNFNINDPIELTFSHKMDKASVESAISFSPTATANYTWINDYLLSIDLAQLAHSTNYEMTINGTVAKSAESGKFLDGDANETEGGNYVINFTTREQDLLIPEVVSHDPQGDQQDFLRPVVRIEFNKQLDESTILPNHITVTSATGETIAGKQYYHAVNGKSVMHFLFNADLIPNETYTVTLAPGIRCVSGNEMVGNFVFTFQPRFRKTQKTTMVQPFTSIAGWSNGGQTGGHILVSHQLDNQVPATIDNTGSLRMNYQWDENATVTRRWRLNNGTANTSLVNFSRTDHNTIQFYLFGDGSHTKFTLVLQRVVTSPNNTFYGKWIEIDWIGWKRITWDLTDETNLTYPFLGGSGPVPESDPLCLKSLYTEAAPTEYLAFTPSSFWVSRVEALQLGAYADFVVTFNSMGGSQISPAYLANGDKITLPENPTLKRHIFDGWYKDEGLTEAWDFDNDVVTANITLYAKWQSIPVPSNYPEPVQDADVQPQTHYTFLQQGAILSAAWLNENNIKRAIHRNGKLYVLTKGAEPKIFVVNPTTLEIIKELNQTGITDAVVKISDIAFTSDDILLACNKELVPFTTPTTYFKVYSWANDDASPALHLQTTAQGNWTNGIVGETMAVSGPSWETVVYTSAVSATGTTIRILGITKLEDSEPTSKYMLDATNYTEANWGTNYQFMISPHADDQFILTSDVVVPTEYRFDMSLPNRSALVNKGVFTEKDGYNLFKTNGANYFRYANHTYMAAPVAQNGRISAGVVLFDITNGLDNAVKLSDQLPAEGLGTIAAPYITAYGTVDNALINLSVLAENQGFATFKTSLQSGLTENNNSFDIKVYPNPVRDVLYIKSDMEIQSIKLMDMSGRVIKSFPSHQTSLNMADVPVGNYILIVNNVSVKIIKK